jgi:hypothetical protein
MLNIKTRGHFMEVLCLLALCVLDENFLLVYDIFDLNLAISMFEINSTQSISIPFDVSIQIIDCENAK